MEKKKPGLMIAVMEGLKKKGKMEPESSEEGSDYRGHLVDISKDLIQAIHSEDAEAVADLLIEAHEACDMQPHEEGEHTNEEEPASSRRY